jgi:hypothetical protein
LGEVGVPYASSLGQTEGLAPLYVFGVRAETPLPIGLQFNGNALVGTPLIAGTFSVIFTVQAAFLATKGVIVPTGAIISAPAPVSIVISPMLAASFSLATSSAQVGVSFQAVIGATGGSGSLIYSIVNGSLPLGLSLSTVSGVIPGSPISSGTYPLTFAVADQLGARSTVVGVISVSSVPLSTGAIIGITVGALVAMTLAIVATIKLYQWHNRSRVNLKDFDSEFPNSTPYYKF